MTTWNEASPTGADYISGGDNVIREFKEAVGERLVREHSMARAGDNADDGKHRLANGLTAALPTAVAGHVYISNDKGKVSFGQDATPDVWLELPFPTGTKMLFAQATAPIGWTKDTDVDDKVLIVHAGATGGAVGGSWDMSTIGITSPAHKHAVTGNTASEHAFTGVSTISTAGVGPGHIHGIGFDSANATVTATIANTATWRPAYQYIIKATKD